MRVNMLHGSAATFDLTSFARDPSSRQRFSLTAPAALILVLTASTAAFLANVRFVAPHLAAARATASAPAVVLNPYGALIDPGFAAMARAPLPATRVASAPQPPIARPDHAARAPTGQSPAPAKTPMSEIAAPHAVPGGAQAALATEVLHDVRRAPQAGAVAEIAAPTAPQIVAAAPLPPPRPAEFDAPASAPSPVRRLAQQHGRAGAPVADHRTFFQKLFGMAETPTPTRAVAYAAPETSVAVAASRSLAAPSTFGGLGASAASSRYDRWTAVYDLAAHTVYMPDGTRLEAHSGLGDRLDDPNHVSERMRGATPPHLYELGAREEPFHGVQALRLNPVGAGDLFGRAGLLAHSYMLGPNGDSNGCVSFRDYDAFLQAFRSGQVKKLAVVARLD